MVGLSPDLRVGTKLFYKDGQGNDGLPRLLPIATILVLYLVYNMTLPTLLFALLVALLYGALYHLIRGGGFWRLILYFSLSISGFIVGHLVGVWRDWTFIPLGALNLGLSSLGSVAVLMFGDWLSRIEAK